VLNSIVIDKDGNGALNAFKTIDFEYSGFGINPNPYATVRYAQKRFFLTKIVFDKDVDYAINTQNGRRNHVYELEYDNSSGLPNRFDYSQDYGGFYNGITNSTSIPDNVVFNPFGLHNLADRTPNFNYAKFGSLKRIYYPTGGYTEFDYEAARKAKKKINKSIALHAWRNMGQYNFAPNNKLSDGVPQLDQQGNHIGIQNVYENQSVVINVKLKAHREQGDVIINQNERATLALKNMTTGNTTSHLLTMDSDTSGMNNIGVVEKDFTINYGFSQGHDYEITITINSTTSNDPIGMEANLFVEYYDGFTVVDDFGVRLKRMIDYANDNQPENIKRYYYNAIEEANSPVDLNTLPVLGEGNLYAKIENYTSNKICNPNPSCTCDLPPALVELWYYHTELLSETINFNNSPHFSNHEYVTVSLGGDNFEKGGIEKRYRLADDYGGVKINTDMIVGPTSLMHMFIDELSTISMNVVSIKNPLNGSLLHEKYYKKDDGSVKKIYFKDYVYTTTEDVVVRNIFSKKEYNSLFFPVNQSIDNTISNFTLAVYKIPSIRNELIQKQVIEYIDPVPLGVTDESTYKKIVTTQDFDYGVLRGLPTTIVSSTSESDVNLITKNYYPYQVGELSGLNSQQIDAISKLYNNSIISTIQVEKYQNTDKLSTTRTLYKDISSNPNFSKIVPDRIQFSKGEGINNPLEDRVRFLEYDFRGNPTLVSLENGTKTKYFYNNRGQVILKIENYINSTSAGSGGELTEEDILNNTSPCAHHALYPMSLVTAFNYV